MAMCAASFATAEEKSDSNFAPAALYLRGIDKNAEVLINDHPVKWSAAEPLLVPPGYLHIRVEDNDTEVQKSFLILPNDHKTFNFKINPDSAGVEVVSKPSGATVSFDGIRAGIAPFRDSFITPGLISVTIDKYGYDTIKQELHLLPQEERVLTCEMKHSMSWLDSVSKVKALRRKKALFYQRVLYGAIVFAGGSAAAYFDQSAQNYSTAATTSANAYDKAASGFQGFKDAYNQNRDLAQKSIIRRNISSGIAAAAAVGFAVTFFF
jgi:hypothetical protein